MFIYIDTYIFTHVYMSPCVVLQVSGCAFGPSGRSKPSWFQLFSLASPSRITKSLRFGALFVRRYIYIYTGICIYVCMHIIFMCLYKSICTLVHMYPCTCVYVYMCMCVFMCVYVYMYSIYVYVR